jgi:hypothetical protein
MIDATATCPSVFILFLSYEQEILHKSLPVSLALMFDIFLAVGYCIAFGKLACLTVYSLPTTALNLFINLFGSKPKTKKT